ncbi:MAG: TonB-dependent receptor [Bacteroidales bacterium]|nr:TonB-dependent receptor [Bacteroidales bacterium]
MKYRLIIIIGLIISTSTFAQKTTGTHTGQGRSNLSKSIIKGSVIDQDSKKGVEYANIVLYSMRDSSIISGSVCDENGAFILKDIKPGRYYLIADFIGFHKTTVKNVTVSPDKSPLIMNNITIKQSSIDIEEVMVIGEKPAVEYKIDKKVVNVSKQLSGKGGSAIDVLQNTPSINTDVEGNITLRGSSSFTVLIDGKPSILDGSDALNQIPANAIDNIEIITNPSAKFDPDGTAGIINIITKKNKLEGISGMVTASVGTGPDYGGSIQLGYRTEKLNISTEVNYRDGEMNITSEDYRETFYNDSIMYLQTNGDGGRNRGFMSAKVGADYQLTEKNSVGLIIGFNNFKMDRTSDSKNKQWSSTNKTNNYILTDNDINMSIPSYQITLTDEHVFAKDNKLTTKFNYNISNLDKDELLYRHDLNNNNTLQENRISLSNDTRNSYRLELDYERPLGEKGKLEAGYQVRFDNASTTNDIFDINVNTGAKTLDPLSNEFDFSRWIHALYATYSKQWNKLDIKLGLRSEYTDRAITPEGLSAYTYSKVDFYPSAYFTYRISEMQQVQANYSRRVNRPRDFFLNPVTFRSDGFSAFRGNPELEPAFANSYELNYQYRFNSSFISLETYYRKTDNKMTRISTLDNNGTLISTIQNLDSDQSLGIEVMANLKLTNWWSINPSYTYYHYQVDGNYDGATMSNSSNNWNARLSNNIKVLPQTSLQIDGMYNSPEATLNGEEAEMYFLNAAIKQDLYKRKVALTFSVSDVFQTRKHEETERSVNFYSHELHYRQAPVFKLSISYTFNNYKKSRTRNGDSSVDYGDFM